MKHLLLSVAFWAAAGVAAAQTAPEYSADVPAGITVPDRFQTRLGTLEYFDGLPTAETAALAYDAMDLVRGITAFTDGMPAASTYAMCRGLADAGVDAASFGIFQNLYNARSLLLTPNTTTIYVMTCTDLSDGPLVLDLPSGILGLIDDAFMRYVGDVGNAGPDQGKGGKYLIVPPDYGGELPEDGYFILRTPSYMNWIALRAFPGEAGPEAEADRVRQQLRIYRWDEREDPPETGFVNLTDVQLNTIHANDFSFFEEMKAVIDREAEGALPEELLGALFTLGIRKGQPFEPDDRLRQTLTEAVAIGTAASRSLNYAPRTRAPFLYETGYWKTPFVGGSHAFVLGDVKLLDARTLFHYFATGITPAMVSKNIGAGSQYAVINRDSDGNYLDGSRTYSITIPPDVPVNNYWSFVVYSTQTRSLLETDQRLAGMDSTLPTVKADEDGSFTIWFAPEAPPGREGNWIQTTPGKAWSTMLRMYGPLEPWFDGTWRPGEIQMVE